MAYKIEFAASVKQHFKKLTAHQRAKVLDEIEKQLTHEPLSESRNRKLLRPNPLAPWELRAENLRVFYEVAGEKPNTVRILAVGIKKSNRLFIAGKEIKL